MALRTLYQTLLDSDPARLRVIAEQWGITLTAVRRPDMAAELADAMARGEAVEPVWEMLDDSSRAALEDLLRHDGAMPWAIFSRCWGKVRAVGPGRLEREALWRTPVSAAEALWYWGLVQRAFAEWETGPVEMAFVPEELRLYLPVPAPRVLPALETTSAPLHYRVGDDTLADDLVMLWAHLQTSTVRPSDEHTWPAAQREALLPWLHEPAGLRFALLETLAWERDWVRRDERGVLRPTPDSVLAWLKSDVWEQWTVLAHAWMASARWRDLDIVHTLRVDPLTGWPGDSLRARQGILEMLRQCQPGQWYALEDFVAYMQAQAPDFLRPDGDYETNVPRDIRTDVPLRGFETWTVVEGALVKAVLTGPLFWVGFVDLGQLEPGGDAVSFCLTEAGAAWLDLEEAPVFSEAPPVRLGEGQVLLVPRHRRYERFQLSRVAQFTGREEEDYHYRLTPSSIARAAHQRISPRRLIEFLETAIEHRLPPSFKAALERAYQEGEVARLEACWVLHVQDPSILDFPALERVMVERLGPRAALIREVDRERVVAFLIAEGILPEVLGEA